MGLAATAHGQAIGQYVGQAISTLLHARHLLDRLARLGVSAHLALCLHQKLRMAYEGSAFLCVRSSDDAEQAIGFLPSGRVNLAQLASFCGESDGLLKTAYDQGEEGNDLTQATKANMPKVYDGATQAPVLGGNGKLAALFNGTTTYLKRADSCGLTGNPALTIAVDAVATGATVRHVFGLGGATTANRVQMNLFALTGPSYTRAMALAGAGNRSFTCADFRQRHVYLVIRAAGSTAGASVMRQSGAVLGELAASSPSATPTLTDVGTFWGTGTTELANAQLNDKSAALLLLNVATTDAQSRAIEGAL